MYYKSGLLKIVKKHLLNGGIIAYPTESCFGFGCDPYNYKAVRDVVKLKHRNKDKGLIVVAQNIKQLNKLIYPIDEIGLGYTKQYWPGNYSFVVRPMDMVNKNLVGKHATIVVRITKHPLISQLCKYLNLALVSTSANKSGFKSVKSYKDCQRQFGNKVFVLPGKTMLAKKPSTIIRLDTREILR